MRKNTTQSSYNSNLTIAHGFRQKDVLLKIADKQFLNHKILYKTITENTLIVVQSTLSLLAYL